MMTTELPQKSPDIQAGTRRNHQDVHVTTRQFGRTNLTSLPFRVHLHCSRVAGWQLWARREGGLPEQLLGGEYSDNWLVIDVAGTVICDNRPASTALAGQINEAR